MTQSQIDRIMEKYGCSFQDASDYIELIEEGFSRDHAKVAIGLIDPE